MTPLQLSRVIPVLAFIKNLIYCHLPENRYKNSFNNCPKRSVPSGT